MKKLNLAMAFAMTMGISALTYLPTGEATQSVEEKNSVTEVFMVQSVSEDGEYVNAKAVNSDGMNEEYILDPIYEIGDVVEVTYCNDDIFAERLITGDELDDILENEYVMAEDGSYVPLSFYK